MDGFDAEYFQNVFLSAHDETLRRYARCSHGRLTRDDLVSDAFLMAIDLGDERGQALDLTTVQDQELLLKRLLQHVNRDGRDQRRHASLEQDFVDSEGDSLPTLGERQAGPADWEPLQYLLLAEEPEPAPEVDVLAELADTYSQLAAYGILLERFAGSWPALAELFASSSGPCGPGSACCVS